MPVCRREATSYTALSGSGDCSVPAPAATTANLFFDFTQLARAQAGCYAVEASTPLEAVRSAPLNRRRPRPRPSRVLRRRIGPPLDGLLVRAVLSEGAHDRGWRHLQGCARQPRRLWRHRGAACPGGPYPGAFINGLPTGSDLPFPGGGQVGPQRAGGEILLSSRVTTRPGACARPPRFTHGEVRHCFRAPFSATNSSRNPMILHRSHPAPFATSGPRGAIFRRSRSRAAAE